MIDIIIIIVIILLIINSHYNFINVWKHITINNFRNIAFIIPIITIYLEKDSIGKLLHTKSYKPYKRKLNESTKKVVAANQQWRCNICKNMLDASYEVDHIIPLYKGGNNEIYNLQALCRNCHGLKTINDKLNI
jgi:5-methylcytosine-specific restriction enzyme A